ncbi:uncharacterized protein LY89DRAFT_723019 [Mollisia scopiformis]|uniref:Uncharacterized protein n=1 Tax=Mollisia scopiformis TaxID=149040 RepID=A0A194WT88_MOLSC|nr:uncharacterized protein LY89DRAFT_723019 [Mollisia scopiformis]KUJ11170.1 hypothetical protein LY89DRAFT_723019 [Mollisia scopiformis]
MADPATIISIINGSLGLAVKVGTVANDLYTLSKRLKYAELTLESVASECEVIQTAWEGIQTWAKKQPARQDEGQQKLFDRLNRSLLFGTMVFSKLEDDLKEFTAGQQSPSFFRRGKVVWNEASFAQHQDRIRGQVAAMTLLLQVINLPTTREQEELLVKETETLRETDESAWTIIDCGNTSSFRYSDSQITRRSIDSAPAVYVRFDFEAELFSGRVYARNLDKLKQDDTTNQGKQPIRNARAELVVHREYQVDHEDQATIFSVSRFEDPNSGILLDKMISRPQTFVNQMIHYPKQNNRREPPRTSLHAKQLAESRAKRNSIDMSTSRTNVGKYTGEPLSPFSMSSFGSFTEDNELRLLRERHWWREPTRNDVGQTDMQKSTETMDIATRYTSVNSTFVWKNTFAFTIVHTELGSSAQYIAPVQTFNYDLETLGQFAFSFFESKNFSGSFFKSGEEQSNSLNITAQLEGEIAKEFLEGALTYLLDKAAEYLKLDGGVETRIRKDKEKDYIISKYDKMLRRAKS